MHDYNALLHLILDTIFEQIGLPCQVLQNNHRFNPLWGLLEIREWGNLQKYKVGNINEWVAW
jgi:hypothetical protein